MSVREHDLRSSGRRATRLSSLVSGALVAAATPALAFAPSEHEAQRTGLERADGVGVRVERPVAWSPPSAAREAWRRFTTAHPEARWRAQWDADLAVPTRVFGRGLPAPGATRDPRRAEDAARALLFAHLDLLAPGSAPSDFELASNELEGGLRAVGFVQRHHGYPVRGGQLSVRIRADRLFVIGAEAYPHVELGPVPAGAPRPPAAKAWLSAELGGLELGAAGAPSAPFVLPLVRPNGQVDHRLVREHVFRVERPIARWSVYLDAVDGTPIAKEQTLRFFDATIELDVPDRYPQNGRRAAPARGMDLTVDGAALRADDAGRVQWTGRPEARVVTSVVGENARVDNRAGPAASAELTVTASGTATFGAPSDELVDAQIAAYHAADFVARYVERVAPNNRFVRDAQVQTNVNLGDTCNAFSDGQSINFFRGSDRCENTARLLDVVMHEYGHTVHAQSIIRGVGRFDGALSEGLSDYLAATIADDPGMGRGFFRDGRALRHLDLEDEAVWPEDIAGDPHTTGLIYGGALWDLRKALVAKMGRDQAIEVVDRLWYEALRRAVDIPSAFVEILAADDDNGDLDDGTPNFCEITAAFARHGLAEPAVGGARLGPLERTGLEIALPVAEPGMVCPGKRFRGASLEWRLRDRPELSETLALSGPADRLAAMIPQPAEGQVVEYRVTATLESGESVEFPANRADPFYELYIGELEEIACTDFETSPWDAGWSHALLAGRDREGADDWQWDAPRGEPGSGDPDAAFSGERVVGNDLGGGRYNGTYQPDKTNALTSPVFDVSGFEEVRLQYRRWLNVEDGFFDQASILADEAVVWTNSSAGRNGDVHHEDREWRFHDVDLSEAASDGQVQLSFRITSDGGLELGGWTIDDLCLMGRRMRAPVCGDGVVEGNEACDDGNLESGDGCEADCTMTPAPVCGDGVLEGAEVCDDGNLESGDGCEADCTMTPEGGTCIDGRKPPCAPIEPEPEDDELGLAESGCGCRASPRATGAPSAGGLLLLGLAALRRRRR